MKSSFKTLAVRVEQHRNKRTQLHIASRRGFTLVQVLVVMGVISMLSAVLLGVFGQTRSTTQQTQCDMRLKAITLALDAHRQETGRFPTSLSELQTKKYLQDASLLHCPSDPRPTGSYNDFYVIRAPRDSDEMPIVACPFHEESSNHAILGFKGRYTKQFVTRPAELAATIVTTVERPGKEPIAGRGGMGVRGPDRVSTGATGAATIKFADNSSAELGSNTSVTVLQSYIEGVISGAPLSTLVKQTYGDVTYRVNHGSKFDVATATATAGALGTVFRIVLYSDSSGWLLVTDGKVRLTTLDQTVIAPMNTWVPIGHPLTSPPPLPCYNHDSGGGNDAKFGTC